MNLNHEQIWNRFQLLEKHFPTTSFQQTLVRHLCHKHINSSRNTIPKDANSVHLCTEEKTGKSHTFTFTDFWSQSCVSRRLLRCWDVFRTFVFARRFNYLSSMADDFAPTSHVPHIHVCAYRIVQQIAKTVLETMMMMILIATRIWRAQIVQLLNLTAYDDKFCGVELGPTISRGRKLQMGVFHWERRFFAIIQ